MATVIEQEFFLSEILGRRIFVKKRAIGRLSDLAIVETGKLPEVTQVIVSRSFGYPPLTVPWDRVVLISNHEIVLDIDEGAMAQFERAPQENLILLQDHILDKKILDMDDHEVEIVYDIKLKVPKAGLSEIHPVDLADILEELEGGQRVALFNALDAEQASDTLEEVEPRVQ